MSDGVDRWQWQRDLRADGEEPDPRFTLANERTFLAWTRTALGLMAAGVALHSVVPTGLPQVASTAIASLLVVLGVGLTWMSWRRWRTVEGALRSRTPLPFPSQLPILTAAVAVAAIVLLVMLVRS